MTRTVGRKYICNAPRHEVWEQKAAALLQALGGDAAKRDALVRQTYQALHKEQ